MRGLVLVLAMLAAAPASAQERQKFDLLCYSDDGKVNYRIDLQGGEWCRGDCKSVFKIVSSTSGEIVLLDEKAKYKDDAWHALSINRTSGKLHEAYSFSGRYSVPKSDDGVCTPAEFSGFPAAKF